MNMIMNITWLLVILPACNVYVLKCAILQNYKNTLIYVYLTKCFAITIYCCVSDREGKIDINIVYTILIKSGLPREVLGHIWNLCNRNTPGELQMDELYLILAMIAIAQVWHMSLKLPLTQRCHPSLRGRYVTCQFDTSPVT